MWREHTKILSHRQVEYNFQFFLVRHVQCYKHNLKKIYIVYFYIHKGKLVCAFNPVAVVLQVGRRRKYIKTFIENLYTSSKYKDIKLSH